MQTVTPQKLFLIALMIGLGAAAASIVTADNFPARKSPMYYVQTWDITRSVRTEWPAGTPEKKPGRQFLERIPFPHAAAIGALHDNSVLEFES